MRCEEEVLDVQQREEPAARDEAFHDQATMDEIDLYTELLIAAGTSDSPLSASELDRILGLRKPAA